MELTEKQLLSIEKKREIVGDYKFKKICNKLNIIDYNYENISKDDGTKLITLLSNQIQKINNLKKI